MEILTGINSDAFQFAGSIASAGLTSAMNYFAISYYLVLAAIAIFLYLRRDKNIFAFFLALAVLFVISEIIKILIQEPRPCQVEPQAFSWLQGGCESGFGFPSSHATTLTGLYLFVKGYRYLNILYLLWLIIILFGRVYLGEHYLTDVIAGIIISIGIGALIYRYKDQINGFAIRLLRPIIGGNWGK